MKDLFLMLIVMSSLSVYIRNVLGSEELAIPLAMLCTVGCRGPTGSLLSMSCLNCSGDANCCENKGEKQQVCREVSRSLASKRLWRTQEL